MKVVLTGATGFIGGEVLRQCLENQSITTLVVPLRHELPTSITAANPKLKVMMKKDFAVYSEDEIRELEGTDACVWCLGKAVVESEEEARKMTLDFTLAAVRALQQASTRQTGHKVRFIYLSGRIAERDQSKSLWYMQEARRVRGQLETELLSIVKGNNETFEAYIVKPSMVLRRQTNWIEWLCSVLIATVKADALAGTMIRIAMTGYEKDTLENSDI